MIRYLAVQAYDFKYNMLYRADRASRAGAHLYILYRIESDAEKEFLRN